MPFERGENAFNMRRHMDNRFIAAVARMRWLQLKGKKEAAAAEAEVDAFLQEILLSAVADDDDEVERR